MKKLLVLLAIITICTPALAVKPYVCTYQKGKTTYFYKYNPGESADQFCEIDCISIYAKKNYISVFKKITRQENAKRYCPQKLIKM